MPERRVCRARLPVFLDVREKRELVERFGLPSAAGFGRLTADHLPEIQSLLAHLDRVLRLAFYLLDQGQPADRTLREQLGEAFLDGLLEAVQNWRGERRVAHTYQCRFRSHNNAEAFMRHWSAPSATKFRCCAVRWSSTERMVTGCFDSTGWRLVWQA